MSDQKRSTLRLPDNVGLKEIFERYGMPRAIKSIRTDFPGMIWHNVGVEGLERIERREDKTVVWYDIYRAGKVSESINATTVSRVRWMDDTQ